MKRRREVITLLGCSGGVAAGGTRATDGAGSWSYRRCARRERKFSFGAERLAPEWISVNVPGFGDHLVAHSTMNTGGAVPALPCCCPDFLSDMNCRGYACRLSTENGLQ